MNRHLINVVYTSNVFTIRRRRFLSININSSDVYTEHRLHMHLVKYRPNVVADCLSLSVPDVGSSQYDEKMNPFTVKLKEKLFFNSKE
jgi:hypothetical protein